MFPPANSFAECSDLQISGSAKESSSEFQRICQDDFVTERRGITRLQAVSLNLICNLALPVAN